MNNIILGIGCVVVAFTLFFPVSTYTVYENVQTAPNTFATSQHVSSGPTFVLFHLEKIVHWDLTLSLAGGEVFLALGIFFLARYFKKQKDMDGTG